MNTGPYSLLIEGHLNLMNIYITLGSIHFTFFSLAKIGRNIRQIRQILLINLNFKKKQNNSIISKNSFLIS